ncbi:MAG: nucleotidyltransferase family protein [Bacteroidota bacterium]
MISAIVLAAGMSRRMGADNKLLLPLDGKPILLHTLDRLQAAQPDEIVLVTGFESQKVEAITAERSVRIVHNPSYETGMTSSIQVGLHALAPTVQAWMICLSDQPFLPSFVYSQLMDAFREKGTLRSIVAPLYNGKRGNPILFGSSYREAILKHDQPNGCKEIVKANSHQLIGLPFDSSVLSQDIDTPNDYRLFQDGSKS